MRGMPISGACCGSTGRACLTVPEGNHKQISIQVWIDVDEGIAEAVLYLNTIPGVRTHASCQGTIGEGGPNPYRPQVMVTWDRPEAFDRLKSEFDMSNISEGWCYVHPSNSDGSS